MRNIILPCTFFIFFGCVTNRSFDNELKVKTTSSTRNIIPILKVVREDELLEEDYYYNKGRKNGENIEDKKRILTI